MTCGCKCYRGDVTVKRNSRLESCVLESEGDTEDDADTDGTHTHTHIQQINKVDFIHLLSDVTVQLFLDSAFCDDSM